MTFAIKPFCYKKRIFAAFIGTTFLASTIHAQTFKEDVKKINSAYEKAAKLSFKANHTYYDARGANTPGEVKQSVIYKDGKKTYNKTDFIETVTDERYSLVIDNHNKIISANKIPATTAPLVTAMVSLDSLMKLCSKIEYVTSGNLKGYKLAFEQMEAEQLTIYFDPKTFFIKRIEIDYIGWDGSQPYVEISYSEINTNPGFPKGIFSTDKYVINSNGKLTLTDKYSSYKLLNYNLSIQ